eukprot:m.92153 g.92153  ORF g.92153 m.92153 type:complete len:338 (-) comp13769_c0_seq1:103-1116(-)
MYACDLALHRRRWQSGPASSSELAFEENRSCVEPQSLATAADAAGVGVRLNAGEGPHVLLARSHVDLKSIHRRRCRPLGGGSDEQAVEHDEVRQAVEGKSTVVWQSTEGCARIGAVGHGQTPQRQSCKPCDIQEADKVVARDVQLNESITALEKRDAAIRVDRAIRATRHQCCDAIAREIQNAQTLQLSQGGRHVRQLVIAHTQLFQELKGSKIGERSKSVAVQVKHTKIRAAYNSSSINKSSLGDPQPLEQSAPLHPRGRLDGGLSHQAQLSEVGEPASQLNNLLQLPKESLQSCHLVGRRYKGFSGDPVARAHRSQLRSIGGVKGLRALCRHGWR